MTLPPAHDWFRPRVAALVAEAAEAGYSASIAVAVITDLINGADYATGPLLENDGDWAQDSGEPAGASREMPQGESPQALSDADPLPLPNPLHLTLNRGQI